MSYYIYRKVIKRFFKNISFNHKAMFTNWLNNTYLISIICPFNFCWEYFSPSYNHFTNNYTVFFDISISLKVFYFKSSTTNSSFNVFNPNSLSWLCSSPLIRWSWLISCCCPRCLTFLVCYYSRYHLRTCHLFYLLQ